MKQLTRLFYDGYSTTPASSRTPAPGSRCSICHGWRSLYEASYGLLARVEGHDGFHHHTASRCGGCGGHSEPSIHYSSEKIERFRDRLFVCDSCGWWQLESAKEQTGLPTVHYSVLRQIDVSAANADIGALRRYFRGQWKDRKHIHPAAFEELVRQILSEYYQRDFEYFRGAHNTPDEGLDIAAGHDGSRVEIAVQIKTRRNEKPIPVTFLREFVGAMVPKGAKHGVFVTTADRYTRPARKYVESLEPLKQPIRIDLLAAPQVLELLRATTPKANTRLPTHEGVHWKEFLPHSRDAQCSGPTGWMPSGRDFVGIAEILGAHYQHQDVSLPDHHDGTPNYFDGLETFLRSRGNP